MRDIGKSRRKEKRRGKINLKILFDVAFPLSSNLVPPRARNPDPDQVDQEKDDLESTTTTQYISTNASDSSYWSMSAVEDVPARYPRLHSDLHISNPTIGCHETTQLSPGIDRLWTGRGDPFIRYPVELNHRIRELLDLGTYNESTSVLYSSNSYLAAFDDRYINIGAFRDACLPVAMVDPAAFHQVLSNALLNMSSRRAENNTRETNDCIKHHALAVKLVNERAYYR
jgi:hypothetical protein